MMVIVIINELDIVASMFISCYVVGQLMTLTERHRSSGPVSEFHRVNMATMQASGSQAPRFVLSERREWVEHCRPQK